MPSKLPFELIYAPEAIAHVQAIDRKHHPIIRQAIESQLRFEPQTTTRNRKELEPPAPFESSWEIRCGPDNRYRVFYDVQPAKPDQAELPSGENPNASSKVLGTVVILAVGEKRGNRLFFAGKEFQ